MSEAVFSIARDFGLFAGPRKARQGPHSGEALRNKLLKFLDANPGKVTIVLDGTKGMGSSFLDEAFGGLIRYDGKARSELERRLCFQSKLDPSYVFTIEDSLARAEQDVSRH